MSDVRFGKYPASPFPVPPLTSDPASLTPDQRIGGATRLKPVYGNVGLTTLPDHAQMVKGMPQMFPGQLNSQKG